MTPTGLLQTNDVIRNKTTGALWRVTKRLGNDSIYAVRIVPAGGGASLDANSRSRGYAIMTEAPYWLRHGWEIVS